MPMDKVYKVVVKNPNANNTLGAWQLKVTMDALEWLEAHDASSYLVNLYMNTTHVVIVLTDRNTAMMLKLSLI